MFENISQQGNNEYCASATSMSKREIEIWNFAIEVAELELHKTLKYPTEACAIIRKLKK